MRLPLRPMLPLMAHRPPPWAISSREEFRRLLAGPPETLTDVQRAARFAYLQKLRFGGKPEDRSIGLGPHYKARFRAAVMQRLVAAAHRRLQGVHVECLDWAEFIRRYDRRFTLFYLDLPYWGHEADYGRGVFARMAELLRGLDGRFLLSINDRPEVREIFAGFEIEAVETRYSANAKATRRVPCRYAADTPRPPDPTGSGSAATIPFLSNSKAPSRPAGPISRTRWRSSRHCRTSTPNVSMSAVPRLAASRPAVPCRASRARRRVSSF